MTLPSIFRKLFNQSGFSFLSVTILILFLSLGTAMIMTMISSSSDTGSVDVTFKKMDTLKAAISVYKSQHTGSAPDTLDNLVTKTGADCAADKVSTSSTYRTLQGWCGPYLDKEFINSSEFKEDAWGTTFQYDKITVKSCGTNRKCGDGDDISLSI